MYDDDTPPLFPSVSASVENAAIFMSTTAPVLAPACLSPKFSVRIPVYTRANKFLRGSHEVGMFIVFIAHKPIFITTAVCLWSRPQTPPTRRGKAFRTTHDLYHVIIRDELTSIMLIQLCYPSAR